MSTPRPTISSALLLLACLLAPPLAAAQGEDDYATVLVARREVELGAQLGARVARVELEEGQAFAKGDLLLALDDGPARAQLAAAEARVALVEAELADLALQAKQDVGGARIARARAVLAGATAKLEADERLYRDKTLSQAEVIASRTAAQVAQAELALAERQRELERVQLEGAQARGRAQLLQAKAQLRLARLDLAACLLRAPFAGRVQARRVEVGQVVRVGDPLLLLLDDRALIGYVLVPVAIGRRLRLGHEAPVRLPAAGGQVLGRVARIAARSDPSSGTLRIGLLIPNADGKLRAGLRGRVARADLTPKRD